MKSNWDVVYTYTPGSNKSRKQKMVGNSNGFFPDINYTHNTNEKFSLNMGYSFGALLFSRELPVVKLSPVTFLEVCTHVFFNLWKVFFLWKKICILELLFWGASLKYLVKFDFLEIWVGPRWERWSHLANETMTTKI